MARNRSAQSKVDETSTSSKVDEPSTSSKLKRLFTSSKVDEPSTSSKVKRLSTSFKLNEPSTSSKVKKPSTSSKVKRLSTSSKVKRLSTSSKVNEPSTSSKVKKPSTSFKLNEPSTSSKVKKPSTSSKVKRVSTSSKLNEPSNSSKVDETSTLFGISGESRKFSFADDFIEISKNLQPNQYHLLGLALGLELNDLLKIQRDADVHHMGHEATVMQMLEKWRQKVNPSEEQMVPMLVKALNTINRKDLADEIAKKAKGIEEDKSELLGEVQSHLRGKYSEKYKLLPSNSKPPLYMPMEHYFVEPELLLLNSNWEKQDNQPIKGLEDIFQNVKHPILMEGDPGCGKTTLSYKLAADWTNKASYICDHFDLLFYWYCKRNVSSVEDIFKEQLKDMKNMEENDFSQLFVKTNILLLLDAFQEVSEETKEKIFPYVKKMYSNITIIVTCRTGHINLKHRMLTENYESFQYDQSHHSHLIVWNTRLKITGFSDESMKTYLKKYFKDDENKLCKALSYIKDGNFKLFKSPLYVFYLAKYISKTSSNQKANLISSKTELYKMIINTLVEQYVKKNKEINTQIDIFHRENKMLKEDFLHLAEITSKKIKSDPSNNVLSNIPQELENKNNNELIKFLTKHLCFSDNHEVLIECKFIDESMFHFFGAFHTHNLEIIEEIKEEIELYLSKLFLSNNILLYAFLAGFLQEKSNILFGSFESFNYAVNIFNDNFQNILLEIKNKEKNILETLKNLQNGKWFSLNIHGDLKDWYSELIKNSGPLKELYLNFSNHGDENNYDYIPQNTSIKSIIIVLDSKIVSEVINFLKTKDLELKKVEMFLKLDENVSYDEFNDKIKNLFEFLEKKQISLTCDFHKKALNPEHQRPENTDAYDNVIANKFIPILNDLHQLNQLSLYHIHSMLFQSMIPEIKRFIKERKNLNGLYVVLLPSDSKLNLKVSSFKEFFKIVSKSNIKCFAFQHELENDLPLSKFFKKKSWDYLCLCGNFKHTFNQNTIPLSVTHLDCRGYIDLKDSNKTKFLNDYKGVRKLTCFDNLIKNVNDGHNCIRNMYETVEEIDVLLQNELNHKWFKLFKKIKRISITFFEDIANYNAHELISIVSNIRTIETVSLYTLVENKHTTLYTFVQQLTTLKQKVSINELHTNLQPVPEFVENFAEMLKLCFREKILKKFSFYIELDKETIFMPSIAKYFFDRDQFQITSEECNDITFSKFPVLDKKLGFCNRLIKSFCISACE